MLTCSDDAHDEVTAARPDFDPAFAPRLRRATVADSAGLSALLAADADAGREHLATRLATLLTSPDDAVLLATGRFGSLFGWLHVHAAAARGARAEVRGLGIAPCARGAGIGPALLAAAERWAQQRGCAGVTVRGGSVLLADA